MHESNSAMSFDQIKFEAAITVKIATQGADKALRERELDQYIASMKATDWKKIQQTLGKSSNESMPLTLSNKVEVENHRATMNAH